LRLINSCITQLKAQGPCRTCNESKEDEEDSVPVEVEDEGLDLTRRADSTDVGSHFMDRARGYRGTSLIRNRHPVGPYSRTMPRLLWWS